MRLSWADDSHRIDPIQEHRAEILGDIANYTDIAPVLQFSEVVVERSDR